ncbi:MAG: hypothetical protein ACRDIB_03665 [Ardenticatenaceae bacterium]
MEREAGHERVRGDPFVPTSVRALLDGGNVLLQPGDIVMTPVLACAERYVVPPGCRLGASLHAMGDVEIGRGVEIAEDVVASGTILWQGGTQSGARNLVGRVIHFGAPPGSITGGIWCETMQSDGNGLSLPAGASVRGIVVIGSAPPEAFVVGNDAQVGGLFVPGAVETRSKVVIGHLAAEGAVTVGRKNRIGCVEGAEVRVAPDALITFILSRGPVEVAGKSMVDTIRAGGEITLGVGVSISGSVLVSEQGDFHFAGGQGWHTQPTHWFYRRPDDSLYPYEPGVPRPEESSLVALRMLNHQLWRQAERLAEGVGKHL